MKNGSGEFEHEMQLNHWSNISAVESLLMVTGDNSIVGNKLLLAGWSSDCSSWQNISWILWNNSKFSCLVRNEKIELLRAVRKGCGQGYTKTCSFWRANKAVHGIPYFNNNRYLRRLFNSIFERLTADKQQLIEVILVDDGSDERQGIEAKKICANLALPT